MSAAIAALGAFLFYVVLLPACGALLGWLVIKLVYLMTLRPVKFFGVHRFLGWQAYFYNRIGRFQGFWSQHLLDPVTNLSQVFEYIGPERVLNLEISHLRPQLDSIVDEVMLRKNQVLWENLPVLLKNRIYGRVHRKLPRMLDDVVEEFSDRLPHYISFKELLEKTELRQPGTMEALFKAISKPAFNRLQFIAMGWGAVGGLVQAGISYFADLTSPDFWMMSATAISFTSYWVARRVQVAPLERLPKVGHFFEGYVARQQKAMNLALADTLSQEVFKMSNIAQAILVHNRRVEVQRLLRRHVSDLISDADIRTLIQVTIGPQGYADVKKHFSRALSRAILAPLQDPIFNRERSVYMKQFLKQKFDLESADFYQFQQVEILKSLATLGGMIGFAIGIPFGLLQFWLLV